MANATITKRRESELSKILTSSAKKNEAINVSTNQSINNVLNEKLARTANLATVRGVNQQEIKQLNTNYVTATQDVLNDKTLDFLIQHSQINAPTFTSIFAGFELAKASRANKLNEQRQSDIQNIETRNEIANQLNIDAQKTSDLQIKQLDSDREREVRANTAQANTLASAVVGDITASERLTKTADDRQVRADERIVDDAQEITLQNIRSAGKQTENDSAALFKSLASGNASAQLNPVNPATTVPAVVSSTPATIQQTNTLDQSDELTDDEILLLNHDRNIVSQSDPSDIFGTPLTSGSFVSSLNEEEQLSLQTIRNSGGALNAIQQLNQDPNNGVSIIQPGELSSSEIELLKFNRDRLNTTDVPSELIDNESSLDQDELLLLTQIRESGVATDEITGDELVTLGQSRRLRLGEQVPLASTNVTGLDLLDLDAINEGRLNQLLEPVVNSPTPDELILFTPEVIEQIGLLNDADDDVQIDPLQLQQNLISQGVEVSELTLEEFNRQLELDGEQQ